MLHCSFWVYLKFLSYEVMLNNGAVIKGSPASAGDMGSIPGSGQPWRRKWQPTPVFLPGKSHGQRSFAGYSSLRREGDGGSLKESDMTENAHDWLWITESLTLGFMMPKRTFVDQAFQCIVFVSWTSQCSSTMCRELPRRILIIDDSQGNDYQLYLSISVFPLKCTLSFSING